MLCDKHVPKMIVETAQMLATAYICPSGKRDHPPGCPPGLISPYRHTHFNHPASLWSRSNHLNHAWLIYHGLGLCSEFELRFGRTHKTLSALAWFANCYHDRWQTSSWPNCKSLAELVFFQQPPQCMPEDCKIGNNSVAAYRRYYLLYKSRFASWSKNRKKPDWWNPDSGK
jgi:hypothetical protein